MVGVVIAGMSLNFINALLSNGPSQSSFAMLNSLQLIMLLPLIGAYLPFRVIAFITGMDVSLLDLDFFDYKNSKETNSIIGQFKFEQEHPYLYLIGLEYGSSIVNLIAISGTFLLVPVFHIVILVIYHSTKN